MTDYLIRPALKREAADLAMLDNIAGHGISQWFWQKAVDSSEADDALDWGRGRLASDELFAWRNAYVAIHDDRVAGSITSYVMPPADSSLEDAKRAAPEFVPVWELNETATNSWFIDSFAVFQEHQKKGLGDTLLKNSLMRGKHTGAKQAMLICEDTNTPARSLYEKHGFVEIDSRPFLDFGLNQTVNQWLLMAADY